jgi:RecA-family ATPase
MTTKNKFIIDNLFPRRSLHIVAGASGAGKTVFLLSMMTAWARGESVLGFASHPEPWLYVSGDRSEEDVMSKLDSLGIPRTDIPLLPAYATGKNTLDWQKIFVQILDTQAKVIVWEGFGRYVPDNAGSRIVDAWIEQVTYQAQKHDLTIIGIAEQPKMKPRDKYPNPRQRISGPAAWGHHTSTVVLIEPTNEKKPSDPHRTIYFIVHDGGAPIEVQAVFEDTRLKLL